MIRKCWLFLAFAAVWLWQCCSLHSLADNSALLAATLRTYQRAGCDSEQLSLSCPRGTSISIELAQYGRAGDLSDHSLCPPVSQEDLTTTGSAGDAVVHSGTEIEVKPPETCTVSGLQYALLQTVVDACQKKRHCKFAANSKTHSSGDPCSGIRKFVEIAYKCRPYEFRSKVACENDNMPLVCNPYSRIAIYSATFGHTERESVQCGHGNAPVSNEDSSKPTCLVSYATETVMQICHGRRRCSVTADAGTFGRPCKTDVRMYLKVVYTCIPRKVLKDRYETAPEADEPQQTELDLDQDELYDDDQFDKESEGIPPAPKLQGAIPNPALPFDFGPNGNADDVTSTLLPPLLSRNDNSLEERLQSSARYLRVNRIKAPLNRESAGDAADAAWQNWQATTTTDVATTWASLVTLATDVTIDSGTAQRRPHQQQLLLQQTEPTTTTIVTTTTTTSPLTSSDNVVGDELETPTAVVAVPSAEDMPATTIAAAADAGAGAADVAAAAAAFGNFFYRRKCQLVDDWGPIGLNCTDEDTATERVEVVGFLVNWFQSYQHIRKHQEEFYLYLIISVAAGVLLCLTLVIGRLTMQKRRSTRKNSNSSGSNPSKGFGDGTTGGSGAGGNDGTGSGAKFQQTATGETHLPDSFGDDISDIDADIDLTSPMPVPSLSSSRNETYMTYAPTPNCSYGSLPPTLPGLHSSGSAATAMLMPSGHQGNILLAGHSGAGNLSGKPMLSGGIGGIGGGISALGHLTAGGARQPTPPPATIYTSMGICSPAVSGTMTMGPHMLAPSALSTVSHHSTPSYLTGTMMVPGHHHPHTGTLRRTLIPTSMGLMGTPSPPLPPPTSSSSSAGVTGIMPPHSMAGVPSASSVYYDSTMPRNLARGMSADTTQYFYG